MLVQLQYVRAIASLLVVFFHAILQLRNVNPSGSLTGLLFGSCGVDLFFVLSGFVMWVTTSGKPISTLEFYWKRIRRILPLYWSATILAAGIALVAPSILRSTKFDVAHTLASLFFVPWINPADPQAAVATPVIIPGWTLNYEMYFYFLFGGILLFRNAFRPWLLVAALSVVSLACALAAEPTTATRFYGNLVVFEFVGGVFIGQLYMSRRLLPSRIAWPLVLLAFVALLYGDYLQLSFERLLTAGIPAMLVICSIASIDFRSLRPLPWLRYLGDASYSIYITHIFVLAGARMVHGHLPGGLLRNEYLFVGSSIVAAAVFGVLVHRFFEAPVDRYLSGRSARATVPGASKAAGGPVVASRPAVTTLPGE